MLNGSQCSAVERIPGKVSGVWLFKGTRVPVQALFENLESGATVENFLEWFPGSRALPGMFRIKQRGPRVFTGNELLKHGYPLQPSHDAIYAVFDVEPDAFYAGWEWRYEHLARRKSGVQSAEPFAVTLAEVLAIHRI